MEFTYDSMWNVSELKFPDSSKETYEYDRRNRLKSVTDSMGNRSEFEYDANGNCILEKQPGEEITKYTYNARNEVERILDPEGNSTCFSYNEKGLLTERTDSFGNKSTFAYDEAGQKIRETDAYGNTKHYTYTPLGKLETATDELGNQTVYQYETGGRLREKRYPDKTWERFSYDENGNVKTHSFSTGLAITYEYDCLNRVISAEGSDGEKESYTYDANGNVKTVTDALGNTAAYEYSKTGQLIKGTDALGNTVTYERDKLGRVISVNLIGDTCQTTTYKRNLCGQVEMVADALGFEEHYSYDANGNLVKKKDKDGYVTKFGYTKLGKLNHIRYSDNREVTLQYNPIGQLIQVKDWIGTTQMENDVLGRIRKVEYPDGHEVTYSYNQAENAKSIRYPDGNEVYYSYDQYRRLAEVKSGERVISYQYDEAGRIREKKYPNGIYSAYQYDERGRLLELTNTDTDGILDQFQYTYDANGNQVRSEIFRRGLPDENGKWEYSYDALRRLSEVKKEGRLLRSYTYDAFGNRLSKTEENKKTEYIYNRLNQLISQKITSNDGNRMYQYQYDHRGNTTKVSEDGISQREYKYGAINRLEQVANVTGEYARYQYNGLGYRVGKMAGRLRKEEMELDASRLNPDTDIIYYLDFTRSSHNVLEKKENGNSHCFLWDADLLGAWEGEEKNYYINDKLGSPVHYSDSSGTVIESYGYDEFGERTAYPSQTDVQPFGYTGYLVDPMAKTLFAQAREYEPQTGRFLSEDRIKGTIYNAMTWNPYCYCVNQPFDFLDLTGLTPEQIDWLLEGNEAHRLLQAKFLSDYGGRGGVSEYQVTSGITRNSSGTGRADIVYFNSSIRTVEVYEIKPGSYAPGAVNYVQGISQLDGYIDALRENGQIINNWKVKKGYSLNAYFNTIEIPSVMYPDKEIVYRVYENGLINYYYRKKEEEPEPAPGTVPEKDYSDELAVAAEVLGTAGAAYVIYRVIRMIPSLFPALWWTIPANATCP